MTLNTEDFWSDAVRGRFVPRDASREVRQIGDPKTAGEDVVDGLLSQIKRGKKRGTAPCLLHLERSGLKLSKPGDYWILLDSKSLPDCIVKVTKVEQRRFADVDEEWAQVEGEADGSLEYWAAIHRWYHRKLHRKWGEEWSENSLVVMIYFDLIYPVGQKTA